MKKEIGEKVGLAFVGKNKKGENEFVGTKQQWDDADILEEEVKEMQKMDAQDNKQEQI